MVLYVFIIELCPFLAVCNKRLIQINRPLDCTTNINNNNNDIKTENIRLKDEDD